MALATPWWEQRRTMVLLALAMAIPLIWPVTPPLTDLPGHMGRYAVQIGLKGDPVLGQWYDVKWQLMGNLGMDLLVQGLAPTFGLEPTVKALVMAIPVLTAAAMLWVAREIHGRIPPTAIFALPLTLGYPFQLGFVNFLLSVAFALLLFAMWLRITRQKRWLLRAVLFVPASFALWLTHIYGLGLLGLMVGGAELIRYRDSGLGWGMAFVKAGLAGIMLAGPLLLTLGAASGPPIENPDDWRYLKVKLSYLTGVFRDRWHWLDVASFIALGFLLIRAAFSSAFRWNRHLLVIAALFAVMFVAMPYKVLSSAYADMRLVPILLAIAVLAIKPVDDPRLGRILAMLGFVFLMVRLIAVTASFAIEDQRWRQATEVLDHIPRHARVLSFVGRRCSIPGEFSKDIWLIDKPLHLPALALVRRHAFVNDQWVVPNTLLTVKKKDAPEFAVDSSQMVVADGCQGSEWLTINAALARFPRPAFDYVWLISPPKVERANLQGLRLVWTNNQDWLYLVVPSQAASEGP
jgi:hypothetical protein